MQSFDRIESMSYEEAEIKNAVAIAQMTVSVQLLSKTVDELRQELKVVTESLHKAQGAMWLGGVVVSGLGVVGGIVGAIFTKAAHAVLQ